MFITISDFAKERAIDRDTVNAWIRNHEEVNKACRKAGKEKTIDTSSEAYQLLEKQYPLPRPIQIIEDTESRQKLIKLQEAYIQLQGKMVEASNQLAQAEATKLLLEDKEEQLEKAEKQRDKAEERADKVADELQHFRAEAEAKIKELEEKLQAEKDKSWWQKLRGK